MISSLKKLILKIINKYKINKDYVSNLTTKVVESVGDKCIG